MAQNSRNFVLRRSWNWYSREEKGIVELYWLIEIEEM